MAEEKVLLWGIGEGFSRNIKDFMQLASARKFEIIGVVASSKKADFFCGLPWLNKRNLRSDACDFIVVMSDRYFPEIMDEAIGLGFPRKCIINIGTLSLSGYEWDEVVSVNRHIASYIGARYCSGYGGLAMIYQNYGYPWSEYKNAILGLKSFEETSHPFGGDGCSCDTDEILVERLQKSQLSIFSMNCCGGFFYHTHGMRFYSPFINMFVPEMDFLKFLQEPRRYMQGTLQLGGIPFQEGGNKPGNNAYPLFYLGDVALHMNHYTDIMQAAQKWYERAKRISWDNAVAIMYSDNPLALRRIEDTSDINTICIVPFESDSPSALCIEREKMGDNEMWRVAIDVCIGNNREYHRKLLEMMNNYIAG